MQMYYVNDYSIAKMKRHLTENPDGMIMDEQEYFKYALLGHPHNVIPITPNLKTLTDEELHDHFSARRKIIRILRKE